MKAVKPKHPILAGIFLVLMSPFIFSGIIAGLIVMNIKAGTLLAKQIIEAI